jgi:GNAT superfamily N-acetyltransferase
MMSNEIQVRRAGLADLAQLAVLFDGYRQFYGKSPDVEGAQAFLSERLSLQQSVVYLARNALHDVGFVQLYPSFSSVSMAPIWVLNDLFVDVSGRRQGVASALLTAAVAHARSTGAMRLELSTGRDNVKAQACYDAHGWQRNEDYYTYDFFT